MSGSAYELLLQANEMLTKGKREEAITAYREVLRLSPTSSQRQVAEHQLRELGELPYTFASSGKVIRRESNKRKKRGGSRRREQTQQNARESRIERSGEKGRARRAPTPVPDSMTYASRKKPKTPPPSRNVQMQASARRVAQEDVSSRRSVLQGRGGSLPDTSQEDALLGVELSSPAQQWEPMPSTYSQPKAKGRPKHRRHGRDRGGMRAQRAPERHNEGIASLWRDKIVEEKDRNPSSVSTSQSEKIVSKLNRLFQKDGSREGRRRFKERSDRRRRGERSEGKRGEKRANKRSFEKREDKRSFEKRSEKRDGKRGERCSEKRSFEKRRDKRSFEKREDKRSSERRSFEKRTDRRESKSKSQRVEKLQARRPRKLVSPPQVTAEPKQCYRPRKQRAGETADEFQQRVERYQIWKKYQARYADIDLNTAWRLHEEELTLRQFRRLQRTKRRDYLKRRSERMKTLREQNSELPGHAYLQVLMEEREPLWMGQIDQEHREIRLLENKVFRLVVRDLERRRRCKLKKLDLAYLCALHERETLQKSGVVDLEHAAKHLRPAVQPDARFSIDDDLLYASMDKEQFLCFRLLNGVWLRGYVLWFDAFQVGLQVVLGDGVNESDYGDLLLFRHAIDKINKRRPSQWNQWPSLEEHLASLVTPPMEDPESK